MDIVLSVIGFAAKLMLSFLMVVAGVAFIYLLGGLATGVMGWLLWNLCAEYVPFIPKEYHSVSFISCWATATVALFILGFFRGRKDSK